jgi:hypothetical protein
MRQLLHLQHHRHTGKLLHHEHTSYRALAVVFVISGFFIVSLNMASRAAADEFGVSAMVNVPVPTSAPVIDSLPNNATEKSGSLLVTGSCPLVTPQVVVSIDVDSTAVGTAACDSNNDFSVPINIGSGVHRITASALTISGQQGPTSEPVTITVLTGSIASNITIAADQPFIYVDGKSVTWTGTIIAANQGTDHVHVDWGDGNTSDYTVSSGAESFTHTYATLASHNVTLDVVSANGETTFEQFGAAAFASYTVPIATSTQQPPFFETSTVIGLYGLYITALSVMSIIWLEAKHSARQHRLA